MIRLGNAGPYSGPGTTYKFGNTFLTVPAQYVISPASNGSDVRSAIQWLNSLGFSAAAYNGAPPNPGASTLVKYGALFIWIPNQYWTPSDPNASLYNFIDALRTGASAPSGTGAPAAGSSSPVSTATSWITGSTIISGVPNYLTLGGAYLGFRLLKGLFK